MACNYFLNLNVFSISIDIIVYLCPINVFSFSISNKASVYLQIYDPVNLNEYHENALKLFGERYCKNVIDFHFQMTQKGDSLDAKSYSFTKS